MSTTTIKAIETMYNGYRFRSRLEARWAVFFDTLGIRYEYEKEGYELNLYDQRIRYLPDFWLPDLNCWVEIKGRDSTGEEQAKAALLALRSDQWVFLFDTGLDFDVENEAVPRAWGYDPRGLLGPAYSWCECPVCHKFGIHTVDPETGCGAMMHIPCLIAHVRERPRENATYNDGFFDRMDVTPALIAAYTAARQAQFEHGKRGR